MKTTNNFIDLVLPTYGNPKENIPVYNEAQRMFITSNYISEAGNLYFKGIRFSDRLIMVEQIGLYHNWTYISGIELYAFDGKDRQLIAKKQYDKTYYNVDFIKEEAMQMAYGYLDSQMILKNGKSTPEIIQEMAQNTVESMYFNQLENIKKISTVSTLILQQ